MSDIPYMACPLCGKNFHQSFECDHDEYDLVAEVKRLREEIRKAADELEALLGQAPES